MSQKDVVFIAKPLLDTLVYRAGSLVGAAYFTAAMGWGLTPKMRQYAIGAPHPHQPMAPHHATLWHPATLRHPALTPYGLPCDGRYLLFGVALIWAGNSWWLGILAERQQKEQESAKEMM